MSLYLTAILPPSLLSEEIHDIRKEISERFSVFKALKPPVHITLYKPVSIDENTESRLIKLLRPVASSHSPFMQQLENYESFNNQTLYIRAVKSPELSALQKDIASVFNRNKIDPQPVKSKSSFTPHITIAYRDVSPEVFVSLWEDFKNRKFRRNYQTESFSILKHDGSQWNVLEEFRLSKPHTLTLF